MKKICITIFGVSILMLMNCRSAEKKELDPFIGVWSQELDRSVTIEFTQDGYYYDSRYNKHSVDLTIGIGKLDGSIKEENFGRLIYKVISKDENNLIVSIYGENNGVEFRRKGYIFEQDNNRFIEIIYKMGKGLEEHIQYAVHYIKLDSDFTKYSKTQDSLVLVLPRNFDQDIFFIAFGQDVEDADVKNINEDRKVYISNDGFDRISLKENVKVLLDGSVSAYLTDEKGALIPVFTMQANEWKHLIEKSEKIGISKTKFPVPTDSIIIFSSCRFNPSRAFVNKTFKNEIIGNVLDFRYSTIKDELGYLGIE